jgi:hypothetical protein
MRHGKLPHIITYSKIVDDLLVSMMFHGTFPTFPWQTVK